MVDSTISIASSLECNVLASAEDYANSGLGVSADRPEPIAYVERIYA
jgi:hypothetical protein